MDEDSSVRVLHFLNPYLLWVEVKKHDTFTLRQVGLFGVVPTQASLVHGERVCTKSDRWDPRVNDIVEEFLDTKHHLYFKPTYRLDEDDNPTSLFGNHPHIFGELSSVRKQDGARKQLVSCLENSVYAYKSRNDFWQMLNEGKIKTQLEENEAIDVLQKIVQHYQVKGTWDRKKETFLKYLSPSQVAKLQFVSPKLTTKNLEKHLMLTSKKKSSISIEKPKESTPKQKEPKPERSINYQDFNCNTTELAPVKFVEDFIKKYTVVENKPVISTDSTIKALSETASKITVYDEEINPEDSEDETNNASHNQSDTQKAVGRANSRMKHDDITRSAISRNENARKIEELIKFKEKLKRPVKNDISRSTELQNESQKPFQNGECSPPRVKEDLKEFPNRSQNASHNEANTSGVRGFHKEAKKSFEKRSQEYEKRSDAPPTGNTQIRLVAYGPPMSNKQCLVTKQVNKYTDELPTKQVEHTDTWRGGNNINWEDDVEIKSFDKTNKTSRNCDKKGESSRNFNKSDKVVPKEKNVLDVFRNYNDYIQSKQENAELLELPQLRGGGKNSIIEQNDSGFISTPLQDLNDENKENNIPVQKNSRSKLLELLRKRKVPESKDSPSNDDDSLVKNGKHLNDTSSSTKCTKSSKEQDSDDDDLEEIHAKLDLKHNPIIIDTKPKMIVADKAKIHVNPYKNLDGSKSVFVEDLIQPLLLAHSKNDDKILPQSSLRDIPFKVEIHNTLRNMQVKTPSRLQSVSWPYILRGHSMIMISAVGSGKTLGYMPAVCNLVLDYNFDFTGLGPICIIVCATALSVTDVAKCCRMFLNHQRVVACFPGVDNTKLATDLINGCDILVSTPSMLYRLLGAEIGVDLRRLTTLVFEDCERLSQVYELEVKAIQLYVKQMLKSRTDKQVKVQYIVASRNWCNFMNRLAKKAPDTIITFAAFHECVLYSKTNTSVSFVKKNRKVDAVVEFLKETDDSKLTVIVCRSDDEVDLLESTLTSFNFAVVACNNQMTIHDLYKIRTTEFNSILICCDGNLNHLKVTYANYLVHFSLPAYYTQFCARFAVLNENYPSVFGPANENVKIKIILEETNVEQLPKILNFVKRCSSNVPEVLNEIARKVLEQKDLAKAEKLVPVCDSLLSLGECADMYTCQERHAILEGFDDPKTWMPCFGIVTFKIIHYHSAISYSARLLTHVTGNNRKKYPETYATLCMKLGMFFSKEHSRRLHGEPKVGDICAISVRKNFIARCQVLKIKDYEKGQAKHIVINLIDEEQIAVIRAVELYYLPEEFKAVETHVVKVRLANIKPQDKDVTFSELAMNKLKKLTDDDEKLYLKGRVVMTVGNTIFVETLEACEDLSALAETVVKYNFKKLLLDTHAIPNSEHLSKLRKICEIGNLKIQHEPEAVEIKPRAIKKATEHRWAHLEKNDWSEVIFSNTINAEKFFVRPQKFDKCVNSLISDIRKYVEDNPKPIENVCVKDVVLAEYPDDCVYERAMIEEIIDDFKVKCFFVDNADWRDVAISRLIPIPQKFIEQIPFQSIECRLIGVKPPGDDWSEFSTNWLHDNCLEDDKGNSKRTYVKYFTKEKAEVTGGHKYGVILVDTTAEDDLVINKRMIELNLAAAEKKESKYLEKPLDFVREKTDASSFEDDLEELQNEDTKELQIKNVDEKLSRKALIPVPIKLIPNQNENIEWETNDFHGQTTKIENDNKIRPYLPKTEPVEVPRVPLKSIFAEQPIRSFPLVSDSDEDEDKWDVCISDDLGKCFGVPKLSQSYNDAHENKKNKSDMSAVVLSKLENASSTPKKDVFKSPTKSIELEVLKGAGKNQEKNDIETTNGVVAEETDTELKIVAATREKNKTAITEVMNSVVHKPTNDIDILKGEIKDVSLYDSDDTLSISNDKIEIAIEKPTKKCSLYKNEPSVLDSDDTQSFLSENDKEVRIEEKKELNNTGLDSDDLDLEDLQDVPEKPRVVDKVVKNANGHLHINKAIKIVENMKVNDEKTNMHPITTSEIPKTGIATNDKYPVNIVEINKAKIYTNINVDKDQSKTDKDVKLEDVSTELKGKTTIVTESTEPVRTPQLVWRQDKNTIIIKIKLAVDEYTIETGNRSLKFSAYQNEVKYAFDIELYGVIETEKTKHSNKGQYILVNLVIMLKKTTKWLKLTKDTIKNWILYDVDSIDTSSDEEMTCNDDALKTIMDHHEKAMEFDDDDDDMDDTSGYRYRDDD